jgi:transposase-like protein
MAEVAPMLKAIHAQEDREAAMEKGASVKEKLLAMRLGAVSKILEAGLEESLSYMSFPREHRVQIRTNNAMERLNREIRRRTRVVGNFPDGQSALMLVAARFRHVASAQWGTRRYLDMDRFNNINSTKDG